VDVSVILRTKNEGIFLERTLRLLEKQYYAPRPEIIILDSGSTDNTLAIAKQHPHVRLMQIPAHQFSYGRSLNTGFRAASGEVIVALSAHAFPCDEVWLKRLLVHFDDSDVAGVYGRQLPHEDAWPFVRREYAEFYGSQLRVQADPNDIRDHYFSNAASAIRRQLWQHHKFNEELPYCEDWEWARAMLRLGYKIVYEPEAAVYHSHNESFRAIYRRCYREALARESLYAEDNRISWYDHWRKSVAGDIRFIRQTGQENRWVFWAVIYRFFWSLGRSLQPSWRRNSIAHF
jgi:rhamnosyltransferase